MEEKHLKCKSCFQPMIEIGGVGKNKMKPIKSGTSSSIYAAIQQYCFEEQKLYQCPKCKNIAIN